jgi:hypothetical protein
MDMDAPWEVQVNLIIAMAFFAMKTYSVRKDQTKEKPSSIIGIREGIVNWINYIRFLGLSFQKNQGGMRYALRAGKEHIVIITAARYFNLIVAVGADAVAQEIAPSAPHPITATGFMGPK